MRMQQPSYRKAFIFSILLHGFVLCLLFLNFQFASDHFVLQNNSDNPEMIQATVLPSVPTPTPKPIPAPLPPETVAPAPPAPIPPPHTAQPLPRVIPVQKPLVVPTQKDVIALTIKKQKQLLQDQLQKQLLADLQKQKAQKKQKALQKSFENEMKNLSQKSLLQQLNNEQIQATNSQLDKMHGIVNKYRALIVAAIGHHWLIPSNADKNSATKLMISLEPGGTVTDVEIVESSGNVALDNSARAAVFKASPLPVPSDPDEFKPFKQFVLVARPIMFQQGL